MRLRTGVVLLLSLAVLLPVGADLASLVLREATLQRKLETFRDWEGHVDWINRLDEDYFDEKMRSCFSDGQYSALGF